MQSVTNCTLDSRLRSFKCNKTEDAMCKECKVSHVLSECNKLELTKNRDVLNDRLSIYAEHYPTMPEQKNSKPSVISDHYARKK